MCTESEFEENIWKRAVHTTTSGRNNGFHGSQRQRQQEEQLLRASKRGVMVIMMTIWTRVFLAMPPFVLNFHHHATFTHLDVLWGASGQKDCSTSIYFGMECPCGISHKEYFALSSVGGLRVFKASLEEVSELMGESFDGLFFNTPEGPDNIYDLILDS
ncbi:hypothetical protein K438DRAFT_1782172 [Mycena galopus ATCC 62051]|nr:hypothetical protein K438DRAFT_1782172 [Mycena galopus ATCC 62051]